MLTHHRVSMPDPSCSTRESLLQSRRAAAEAAQQRQATVADAAKGGAARSRERFHYQPGLEPHTPRECSLALRRPAPALLRARVLREACWRLGSA